ncbi:hypothetical protein CSQ85_08820 [Bifidobacterium rousetti]|uniref:hypothetical protein n=1 Tax=Bifidobacterium rousetti TaxID=2045439 RepID=UPI00123BFFB8|nr:hypothetical protein [Bifidobacterium rousetti]KAA8818253.1 hypothetical protein CSQ85_08820 [Bifidobacterium rousetti]
MNTTTTTQNLETSSIQEKQPYDYRSSIIEDIEDWLDENKQNYDDADEARDDCENTVTGNDNGSYTFSRWMAAHYIQDSGFIFGGDWEEFLMWLEGNNFSVIDAIKDAETMDVWIRLWYFDEQLWDEATSGVEFGEDEDDDEEDDDEE